jgi:hypothetical protein
MMSPTRARKHPEESRRLALERLEDRAVPTCSLDTPGVFLDGPTLCAVGTDGGDLVSVVRFGDELRVYTSQSYLAVPAGEVQGIEIFLGEGNDLASLRPEVDAPAVVHGGGGGDWLTGGSGDDYLDGGPGYDLIAGGAGSDIVLGGDDADWLFGSDGRDVLIGGGGADYLVGQGGDDLLVGGATDYDGDPAALAAIRAEWVSERDYETRVLNIFNGTGSRGSANGGYVLEGHVYDDGEADVLQGQDGQDWFVGSPGDYVVDLDGAEQHQVQ